MSPRVAEACGGCFCPETGEAIVVQTSERLVFEVAIDAETDIQTVTAHVQIAYQGSEDAFAWVVPLPARPRDLGVSTNAMFEELDFATAPTFQFRNRTVRSTSNEGGCGGGGATPATTDDIDEETTSEVKVWSEEAVGPYDTVTISSDDGRAIYDWLRDNGYAIPLIAEPILDSYAESGSYFLAMQLQEDADVDQIEPIRFTFDGNEPCIPLRLTAIATVDELPILAFAFSDGRVVPENYAQVEPDLDQLVLLVGDVTNYDFLVMDAADSAGGRAFVTEFAGPSDSIGEVEDPTLAGIVERHPYLTRLSTRISAREMTVDPTFAIDIEGEDVSNFHVFDRDAEPGVDIDVRGDEEGTRGCTVGTVRLGPSASFGALLCAVCVALLLRARRR